MSDKAFDLLGKTFRCPACGRMHSVNLQVVDLRPTTAEILGVLPGLCRRFMETPGGVALVADERTYAAAGEAARKALDEAQIPVSLLLVPDPAPGRSPVCDDVTRKALEQSVPECELFLAAGSGVVSDLTKWISADHGRPYICFATAPSMNGYASANVAPTIQGVKSLVRGTGPVAVVSSLEILAAAPAEMIESGLGDVVAKGVSALDWRLNHRVFDEYYCRFCVDLIKDIEPRYFENPEGVRQREPGALTALFEALILTGIAMTVAGTSSPASGGEHLISHTLDMLAVAEGTEHDLHGRQVGVGTILAAAIYQEVLAIERPQFRVLDDPPDAAFWGRLLPAVEEKHALKRAKARQAVERLRSVPELWPALRKELAAEAKPPEAFKECLRRAGAAHRLADIGVSRDRFLAALHHAHQMRDRYCILDLARAVGVLPERAEELVDRWLS